MKNCLRKHLHEFHGLTKGKKIHAILKLWKMHKECEFCLETITEDFSAHLQNTHKVKSEEILKKLSKHKPLEINNDGKCVFCGNGPFSVSYSLSEHFKRAHHVSNPEYQSLYDQGSKTGKSPKKEEPAAPKRKSESAKSQPEISRRKSKTAVKSSVSCRLCDTKDIPELSHHLEIYHKITGPNTLDYILGNVKTQLEPVQLTCFLCGKKSFLTLAHMRRHLMKTHLVKIEAERKKFEAMWKEKDTPSFECAVCKECFPTESTLKRHKSSHDIDNGYFCSKCEIEFDSVYDLLKHEKRHEKAGPPRYSCTMCDKKFTAAKDLNNHLKMHKPALLLGMFFILFVE